MGVVIEFQDLVNERRRQRARDRMERCIELIESSLARHQRHASDPERPDRLLSQSKADHLASLLDYASRMR